MNSDMTKYCYQHFENAYNIGWNTNFDSTVESKETFNSIFIEKLTSYCENPLNSDLNGVCRETEIDEKKYVKGFGEIRIIDLKKKIRYAAPNVIIDDILSGKYIPPIEFIDAVLTGPTFDSEEYQEFYLNYSEKNFWGENEENFEKIAKVLELAGDLEGFKDYILNNDLINIVVPEGSLLNYAITEGKEKEALWLIENGIDINAFASRMIRPAACLWSSFNKGIPASAVACCPEVSMRLQPDSIISSNAFCGLRHTSKAR